MFSGNQTRRLAYADHVLLRDAARRLFALRSDKRVAQVHVVVQAPAEVLVEGRGAKSFNQDLGWCVDAKLDEAFTGTKCEKTSCGVKKEAFGTCDEGAIAGYSILIALSCLLFLLAAYVRCKKKKDETYAAAARRVLCRRGTKLRATAPMMSDEAAEQSRDEPALPASMVSVVDAPAAGIAPGKLGTVVSVKH